MTASSRAGLSKLARRVEALEKRIGALESHFTRGPDSILYPLPRRGRKPAIDDSWLLSMREGITRALEPRWSEIADALLAAKTRPQMRQALELLQNSGDAVLERLLGAGNILWDFLQSDRFRAHPDPQRLRAALQLPKRAASEDVARMTEAAICLPTRQIAAAMAGPLEAPGRMGWRRSLDRCGKLPQFLPADFFPATAECYRRGLRRPARARSRGPLPPPNP